MNALRWAIQSPIRWPVQFQLRLAILLPIFFLLGSQQSLGISNGKVVSSSESLMRSMVFFADGIQWTKRCSGILISDRWVLTAAHCADGFEKYPTQRQVFSSSASATCLGSFVGRIVYPPGLKETRFGIPIPDLALLELKTNLCGAEPHSIQATKGWGRFKSGMKVRTAGFGYGNPDNSTRPHFTELLFPGLTNKKILETHYADVKRSDSEYYLGVEAMLKEMEESHVSLFSTNPKSSFCGGDSGGPVYVYQGTNLILLGINSAYIPHPTKSKSQCDTFVHQIVPLSKHLDWIRQVIN